MLDLGHYSTSINVAIFLAASTAVWIAGQSLVRHVDAIADRTGIGQAFAGMLLLGGITASPEIAAVAGASSAGNAALSIGNVLGSVCINLVLLAIADAAFGSKAITSAVAGPATLLQGTLGILALAVTAGAIAVGDVRIGGIGLWSTILFAFVIFSFWLSARYAGHVSWRAARSRALSSHGASHKAQHATHPRTDLGQQPFSQLATRVFLLSVVILFAGFTISRAADAVASETAIGANFIGLVFVAFATALPEFSSIFAAVRLERFEMAISDVFGSNLFNLGLFVLADALYSGEPILKSGGRFEIVAALLGIVLTAIFLVGLLEREDHTILRMGYDSLAVLVIYFAGLVTLYFMG